MSRRTQRRHLPRASASAQKGRLSKPMPAPPNSPFRQSPLADCMICPPSLSSGRSGALSPIAEAARSESKGARAAWRIACRVASLSSKLPGAGATGTGATTGGSTITGLVSGKADGLGIGSAVMVELTRSAAGGAILGGGGGSRNSISCKSLRLAWVGRYVPGCIRPSIQIHRPRCAKASKPKSRARWLALIGGSGKC